MFDHKFSGKRVFVTGHTGFKGTWLCQWLTTLGAEVYGFGFAPETDPAHWEILAPDVDSTIGDVRDVDSLHRTMARAKPHILFHLAAQPLVRKSYVNPLETWSTNVMGTANVLECARTVESISGIVSITTDKVYENKNWVWPYRETDALAGHDPYSASKAGSELVINSYRQSYFNAENALILASVRAGNVIGGGDYSQDRLIPDLVRAVMQKKRLEIRSPQATRPWQHVLESLSGYLLIGSRILEGDRNMATAFNFGPDPADNRSVENVLVEMKANWPEIDWQQTCADHPHEATLLALDISKAVSMLGWKPVWAFKDSIAATAQWYQEFMIQGGSIAERQLASYTARAKRNAVCWAN